MNIPKPDIWCKATDHIPEQIALIQCIAAQGYTYRTADGIYFDTLKLANYGYLTRLDIEDLRGGLCGGSYRARAVGAGDAALRQRIDQSL